MSDAPPSPTPGSGVPASPVVQIEVYGSTVSVNGVVIVHDGTRSLHHVAVQAAAERVAKPRGGPVRAIATDDEGRASMVIHPDGSTTDVELLDDIIAPPPTVVASVAAAPAAFPFFDDASPVASGPPGPSGPPGSYAPPATRTPGVVPGALPGATRTTGGASSGLPSSVVRLVAVVVALAAVVALGVLLLGSRETRDDQARDSGDASPVAASSEEPVTPSTATSDPEGDPIVSVAALPGPNALRLTVTSDTFPTTARVTVTDAAGTVMRDRLEVTEETAEIELDELAVGTATWSVRVRGAEAQTGEASVTAPYAPPPAPTALPVAPVPAVPPVPAPTTKTPQVKKTPQAKPKPQPKPEPKATPKKKKPKVGFGKPRNKRG